MHDVQDTAPVAMEGLSEQPSSSREVLGVEENSMHTHQDSPDESDLTELDDNEFDDGNSDFTDFDGEELDKLGKECGYGETPHEPEDSITAKAKEGPAAPATDGPTKSQKRKGKKTKKTIAYDDQRYCDPGGWQHEPMAGLRETRSMTKNQPSMSEGDLIGGEDSGKTEETWRAEESAIAPVTASTKSEESAIAPVTASTKSQVPKQPPTKTESRSRRKPPCKRRKLDGGQQEEAAKLELPIRSKRPETELAGRSFTPNSRAVEVTELAVRSFTPNSRAAEVTGARVVDDADNKPATNQNKPAANKTKPAANKNKPATNKNKPAANKNKPATNKNKPAATDDSASGEITARAARVTVDRVVNDTENKQPATDDSVIEDSITAVFSTEVDDGPVENDRVVEEPEPWQQQITGQGEKPSPRGIPPAWAEKRHDLAESFHETYNAYQSSLYNKDKMAKGLLVNKYVTERDYVGTDIIITTVGGCRGVDAQTKQIARTSHAKKNTAYKSVQNSMRTRTPVLVIAGDENPLMPTKMPHGYNVLGFFLITDLWGEYVKVARQAYRVYKYRLERLDQQNPPWWAPMNGDDLDMTAQWANASLLVLSQTCSSCGQSSKTRFTKGWTCTNADCEQFFCFGIEKAHSSGQGLTYAVSFLAERSSLDGMRSPTPLFKPLPSADEGHGTDLIARQGYVCPHCHCCSSRVYWNRFVCQNPACTFEQAYNHKPIPEDELRNWEQRFMGLIQRRQRVGSLRMEMHMPSVFNSVFFEDIHPFTMEISGYTLVVYFLPDNTGRIIGSVAKMCSTKAINAQPGGADEMEREISGVDMGLRRNPISAIGHKAEGLTRHYGVNFGAHYKFSAKVKTIPFADAPEAILQTVKRLTWAAKTAVRTATELLKSRQPDGEDINDTDNTWQNFNELLALGYMENDAINYHDDGEHELGPTVATISLGSPSTMSFRPKHKAGVPLESRWQRVFGDDKAKGKRSADTMTTAPASNPAWTFRGIKRMADGFKPVLEIPLCHGDMIIMNGAPIQKLYEHAVTPHGARRFALTCRVIDLQKMSKKERAESAVASVMPAESAKYEVKDVDLESLKEAIGRGGEVNPITKPITDGSQST